jgi:hypothetical protein
MVGTPVLNKADVIVIALLVSAMFLLDVTFSDYLSSGFGVR